MSRNSSAPSRALSTSGLSVLIFIPWDVVMVQAVASLGWPSIWTTHIRQAPIGSSLRWSQKYGTAAPLSRQTCSSEAPLATWMSRPSRVIPTISGSGTGFHQRLGVAPPPDDGGGGLVVPTRGSRAARPPPPPPPPRPAHPPQPPT